MRTIEEMEKEILIMEKIMENRLLFGELNQLFSDESEMFTVYKKENNIPTEERVGSQVTLT